MHAYLRRILIAVTDAVPIEIPPAEIIALRTIFASEETARLSWLEYRNKGFELDSIYRSTGACLLPILGARLSELFPDDPWLGRMTGYYKYVWTRNQTELVRLGGVLEQLSANNIPCLVYSEAPMVVSGYKDLGLRMIYGHQLLIPPEHHARASAIISFVPDSESKVGFSLVRDLPSEMEKVAWSMQEAIEVAGKPADFVQPAFMILHRLLTLKQYCDNQTLWFVDMTRLATTHFSAPAVDQIREAISLNRSALRVIRAWQFFQEVSASVGFEHQNGLSDMFCDLPIDPAEIIMRAKNRLGHILTR